MTEYAHHEGIFIPKADLARLQSIPFIDGLPDFDVRKVTAASSLATSRRRALDIGAHIGVTALLLERSFDVVDAFEPVPDLALALQLNSPGKRINVISKGVSDRAAVMQFEYLEGHGQLSHALYDGEKPKLPNSIVTEPIEVVTIDSLGYDDVDFMKIDVEGLEGPVVFGARETILRCRPVILVEQRGNEQQMHNRPLHEASLFLESLGMVQVPNMPFYKDRVYRFPA